MRILYLHQYFKFPHEAGGTRSYDLSIGFLNLGHDIDIVTSTSDPKYKNTKRWVLLRKDNINVHYMFLPYDNNMSYLRRILVFIKFLWYSSFKILSLKGDIVLATSTPLTIGIPALVKKWFHKTPFIFEVRDVWPEAVIAIGAIKNKYIQKILYYLEFLMYKNASAIVPLSKDMKKSITKRYPLISTKPIQVIENISEISRFQNKVNKKNFLIEEKIGFKPGFTILYAGAFGLVNGLGYVIEFAKKIILKDPSIIFILIGSGAQKEYILNMAKEANILNHNIFIYDSIPKEELPQLYLECDMGSSFVIPVKELWANSANKFFDTLAAGKPILINYKSWQKQLIEEENIGYALPTIINEDSVNNFISYTKDKTLHSKQEINALKVAKENFSANVAIIKYNSLFKHVKKQNL